MREWNHGRSSGWLAAGTLVLGLFGLVAAAPQGKKPAAVKSAPASQGKSASTAPGAAAAPGAEPIVARINGEEISWRDLAEECLARKGVEVLDMLISKKLVEQEAKAKGVTVSAKEIDDEIAEKAAALKMSREEFMKMLKEKRGIPPDRFARDVVWPSLALKKLASPHIKVTEDDIERGFQANYGEKVKCRWVVLDNPRNAQRVWEELRGKKEGPPIVNPDDFERMVRQWSTDTASRSVGGQIQPINRHMSPSFAELEKAAFNLKQDYEISGIIQLAENAYVILLREGRIPASDVKLADVRQTIETRIYDAKLQEQIDLIFTNLQRRAMVENLLTGDVYRPDSGVMPASATMPAEPRTPTGKAGTAAPSTASPKATAKPNSVRR
jgi:foldase protein PrsA